MSIYAKLAEASKLIGHIDKNGTNQHFKFKYQAWDDVLPAVRDALSQVGLWMMPSIESATFDNGRVVVAMRIVIANDKESLETTWYGEAQDRDDKAIQKAATSAFKYFLLKGLMIPCKDDDDTDSGDGAITAKPQPVKRQPDAPTNGNGNPLKAAADAMKAVGVTKEDWEPYKSVPLPDVLQRFTAESANSKLDGKTLWLAIAKELCEVAA